MGKLSTEIPVEQRPFIKIFEQVAYRHQYVSVFDDYLTMLINFFANGEMQEMRDAALAKYSKEEKTLFNQMFQEHIKLQEEMIIKKGNKWYDGLGDIYQTVSSSSKSSAMGQFFTPAHVVDFMALVLGLDTDGFNMVSEPCSGSGRMVLSVHALNPTNYFWAADLDNMCFKMTAINMCLHNAAGVVSWGNTLSYNYHKHYKITRIQIADTVFVPYLKEVDDFTAKMELTGLAEYCRIMKKGCKQGTPAEDDNPAGEHLEETVEAVIEAPPVVEATKSKVITKEYIQASFNF